MADQVVTYENWRQVSHAFSTSDSTKGARGVLEWAYSTYDDEQIIYASSFGLEAIVLIDLIYEVKQEAKVVFLDTELHFPQTYEVIERVKQRFPKLQIEMKKPALTLDDQGKKYGSALWKRNPNLCCHIRKVIPLQEVLCNKVAWISGLRREQSPTRAKTEFLNKDEKFKNVKICPLIHWTWEEVWEYVKTRNLPYNQLHDQHYPSIGCIPCTNPVYGDEDSRAGRWSGFAKTECGLHTN